MASLRGNISTGMNYLRRRFSSDDLYRENKNEENNIPPPSFPPHYIININKNSPLSFPPHNINNNNSKQAEETTSSSNNRTTTTVISSDDFSYSNGGSSERKNNSSYGKNNSSDGNNATRNGVDRNSSRLPENSTTVPETFSRFKKISLPSVPNFPSFSSVHGMTRGFLSQASNFASPSGVNLGGRLTTRQTSLPYNKERHKTILVIDDKHTDWSKYFYGKKVLVDYDIRLEQAEFSQISLASFSDTGVIVEVQQSNKSGNFSTQSFKPDVVLVRQHARDANENWKHIIMGLHYAGIPSVNSLEAIFNFLDKPWVFSHLIRIQKRLGSDNFPLVNQSFFPDHKEMVSNLWLIMPKFPVVVKIGHAHGGVKIDSHHGFQDIASVMAVTQCYSTTEQHIGAECDIYVQKIGNNYRSFMRKAMSGNWKANVGSAILEIIAMNDKYKSWVDECSHLFGGLDLLAVKAIQSKDGKEYIIGLNDSSMTLFANTQDEDCKLIAALVINKLESHQQSKIISEQGTFPRKTDQTIDLFSAIRPPQSATPPPSDSASKRNYNRSYSTSETMKETQPKTLPTTEKELSNGRNISSKKNTYLPFNLPSDLSSDLSSNLQSDLSSNLPSNLSSNLSSDTMSLQQAERTAKKFFPPHRSLSIASFGNLLSNLPSFPLFSEQFQSTEKQTDRSDNANKLDPKYDRSSQSFQSSHSSHSSQSSQSFQSTQNFQGSQSTQNSQSSVSNNNPNFNRQPSKRIIETTTEPKTVEQITRDLEELDSADDTMNNLRKTFAGILGSMS